MNKIISIKKADPEILDLVNRAYPNGYEHAVNSYSLGTDKKFYAFPLKTEKGNYLLKVDVNLDMSFGLEQDEEEGNSDDSHIDL